MLQLAIYWKRNQGRRYAREICKPHQLRTNGGQLHGFCIVRLSVVLTPCLWLCCSADSVAGLWRHPDLWAEEQLRVAVALQTGDSAPIYSSQTAASGQHPKLQQPAQGWQPVFVAAAATTHGGEMWRGCHVLDGISCRKWSHTKGFYHAVLSWCVVSFAKRFGLHSQRQTARCSVINQTVRWVKRQIPCKKVLMSYCPSIFCYEQVKVAFRCTPPLLNYADQAEEEVPPGVVLIQSERSQRTLRFRQDLLIRYSNSSLQVRGRKS